MRIHPAFLSAIADPTRVELVLRLEDGSPWRLTVSRGIDRFIGYYPRVDGLVADGPLLCFHAVDS